MTAGGGSSMAAVVVVVDGREGCGEMWEMLKRDAEETVGTLPVLG